MKQFSYLLVTATLVVTCSYASRASAIAAPESLVVDRGEIATPNLGNLLVHVVSPITSTKILPSTYPLPGQKSLILHVSACRDEFEPASFVLRALSRDMTGVTLTATDLRSVSSSAVIPSKYVDLKIVKPWFQSYYAWNEIWKGDPAEFRQTLVPELLLKDDALVSVDVSAERNFVMLDHRYEWINQKKMAASEQVHPTMQEFPVKDAKTLQPFALHRDTNKQVWATIFVPPDTSPDEYSGEIQVRSNGTLQGTIKINLKVHKFDLAESEITHSIYYRAVLDNARASVGSEYRNAEQMQEELQDLRDHGVRNPTMYQPLSSQELLRAALKLRQDMGMNKGPLYYLGAQTTTTFLGSNRSQAEKRLRAVFSQINEIAQAHNFTSVYIYGKDEGKGEELVAQRKLWGIVHDMGGKVFVAGYTDTYGFVGDLLDTLVFYGQPSHGEAGKWHSLGHKIFSYQNPQSGPENPFLFRLNYGAVLWANDFDGAMPYAYQHCFGSCWNDMDHPKYRDHNLAYPTADGVIDTLAWEGFREAVDDVRYLTTLENLLDRLMENPSPSVRQAYSYMNTLKNELRSKQGHSGKYNSSMEIDLDEMRRKVIIYINAVLRSQFNSPVTSHN